MCLDGAGAAPAKKPRFAKNRFSGRGNPKFSRGLALVFAAEEVAALQFGDDPVDEIVEAARDPREHDVEATQASL